jgi:hypothetical protein
MQWNVLIGICGTLLGIVFGYLGFKRNANNDLKQDTREDTRDKVQLNAKIDVLLSNNAEMKSSFKELDKKLDTFKDDVNIRLTRVEENQKGLCSRVDKLERRSEK